ncbi:STAS domain-containing protein [Ralstonia solanacearum]|uniref:STAS domain-containing protein n=1 Tax=Ralstonia solanacearum TaxID=305 RepID=UPI0005C5051F|nr:STAS domain-containing protein [Ralstonia solanacearum]MDB0542238.1 STAS domain-containing protein [Ralstonia solanacearum]MDB0552490.1 STAS domain-containing protein [Ralstonia solanacearum]MDB0557202.1 STAS domain-containing protein [Ralstonia solanacearum]
MELTIIREASGVLLIRVDEAHLDAGNVKAFKEAISPLLEDCQRVVFDMSALRFVDSSGLGALIACLRRTNKSQGDFKLCGMLRPVQALFELMRMHRVFSIHDTAEDAVRAFS